MSNFRVRLGLGCAQPRAHARLDVRVPGSQLLASLSLRHSAAVTTGSREVNILTIIVTNIDNHSVYKIYLSNVCAACTYYKVSLTSLTLISTIDRKCAFYEFDFFKSRGFN